MAGRRRRTLAQGAAVALLACASGCRAVSPDSRPAPSASGERAQQSAAPRRAALEPLASASAAKPAVPTPLEPLPSSLAPSGFLSLSVASFRDAVVSVPLDTSKPRGVALALHGNFDRPEWQCEVWRRITQASVWILCPRGIPRGDVPKSYDRWEWGSVAKTKLELQAALAALRERFGAHVRPAPLVFTGFSLGAILGARLLQDPELGFAGAVLIEGGYQGWTRAKAEATARSVGPLLFACGQTECRNAARQQTPVLEKAGLKVLVVADVKAGHTYDASVAALVQAEWPGFYGPLLTQAEAAASP